MFIHSKFSCSGPNCMASEKRQKKDKKTGICMFDVVLRLWQVCAIPASTC